MADDERVGESGTVSEHNSNDIFERRSIALRMEMGYQFIHKYD